MKESVKYEGGELVGEWPDECWVVSVLGVGWECRLRVQWERLDRMWEGVASVVSVSSVRELHPQELAAAISLAEGPRSQADWLDANARGHESWP